MSEVQEFRHVLVIEDRKGRRIISLEEDSYTIGRDSQNQIVLYDYQVSRTHASLIRSADDEENQLFSYRIVDGNLEGKKSTNGIFINGEAAVSHELKHGDTILFAKESKANYYILSQNSGMTEIFNLGGSDSREEPVSNSDNTIASQAADTSIINQKEIGSNSAEQAQLIRLASFPELSPNPIIELDWEGNLTYVNPAASLKFATIYEEKLNHPILTGLLSEYNNRQGSLFLREVKIGSEVFEQYVHYLSEKKVIRSYIFDFTKRKQAEAQLRESQARYQTIVRQTSEGIFLAYASNRRVLEANNSLINLLGYSREEITNLTIYNIIANDLASLNNDLNSVFKQRKDHTGKYLFRLQDGALINLEASISLTTYQNKDIFCFVVHNTQKSEQEDLSNYPAYYDALTDLPNQKLFEKQFALAITDAKKNQSLMGLIAIEIDNWQPHIENLSSEECNNFCHNFSQILQSCLKKGELLAKWDDNKFMMLIPRIKGPKEPVLITKKISATIAQYFETKYPTSKVALNSNLSLLIYPIDGDSVSSLTKNILTTLEQNKKGSNNSNYNVMGFHLSPKSASLLKLENLIGNAVKEQQFFLCYQPQIDTNNRNFTGFEALLRWEHPELGKVTPRHFLRLTEESDFMLPLGIWILQTAALQMHKWLRDDITPFPMGINISSRQLWQSNFVETVVQIIEQTGLPPELLELEFTEHCFKQNPDLAYQTLEQLSELKIRLCLDNFGSGDCSLIHLQKIPFSTVKINSQLVNKLETDTKNQAFIQSLSVLCQGYGSRLIAVGIEKIEQMELLRQLGCTQIQGNLFSRPLPLKEATIFLQKSEHNIIAP